MAKKFQETAPNTLNFYAVRNRDGQWLRRKGYGGYGECWVDDLKSARIYNGPGGARGQVSWWYQNYPSYGCPELVIFTATITEVVNEADNIDKKKAKKEKAAGIQRLSQAKEELKKAQQNVKAAEQELFNVDERKGAFYDLHCTRYRFFGFEEPQTQSIIMAYVKNLKLNMIKKFIPDGLNKYEEQNPTKAVIFDVRSEDVIMVEA